MDAIEMQFIFQQRLKNDYSIDIDIPTVDIDFYLTEGQRRIVEEYYKVYETTEKARKVLNYLVVSDDISRSTGVNSDQTGVVTNGELWKLPEDAMYSLKEEATININLCDDISEVPADWVRVYVKPINMDYYSLNVGNPFKKPYSGMVWRMDTSNTSSTYQLHQLITGGAYRVQTYHITYLAYPESISVLNSLDCKLPVLVHQDIVDMAIRIALESLQTNVNFKLGVQPPQPTNK